MLLILFTFECFLFFFTFFLPSSKIFFFYQFQFFSPHFIFRFGRCPDRYNERIMYSASLLPWQLIIFTHSSILLLHLIAFRIIIFLSSSSFLDNDITPTQLSLPTRSFVYPLYSCANLLLTLLSHSSPMLLIYQNEEFKKNTQTFFIKSFLFYERKKRIILHPIFLY